MISKRELTEILATLEKEGFVEVRQIGSETQWKITEKGRQRKPGDLERIFGDK